MGCLARAAARALDVIADCADTCDPFPRALPSPTRRARRHPGRPAGFFVVQPNGADFDVIGKIRMSVIGTQKERFAHQAAASEVGSVHFGVTSGQTAPVQTSAYYRLNKVSPTNPNAINPATPSAPIRISACLSASVGNIALPMILIALAWDIATSSAMLPTVPLPPRL